MQPTEVRTTTGDRSLFALFVDRPVLTLMFTLAIVVVGIAAFVKVPLRFAPEGLTDNEIYIWVPVRQNRTPSEVEDRITKPFEELLRTIPGIKEVQSESETDEVGFSVQIDAGMDATLAAAEVRDRAQRARLQWPTDVDQWFSWREDASSVPLAFFQMLTPLRDAEWDFLIDKVVVPRLEGVDGVGRVEVWGLLDESLRIWFDREKLVAHRIDFRRLIERLATDNFAAPVGELDNGNTRVLLRVDSRFHSEQQIGNYPVQPGLVLADIARIERVPSVRNSLSRYNQKYTYSGMVRVAAGSNPVDASQRLQAAVQQLSDDPRLRELEFRFLFDQGAMITESLDTLLSSALQGGVLALITLLLFLRNLRFTIAIALAIPLTMLIVGGWLFFTDDSLNILTMAGMTLAIGMVVDNSVVVLENIRRLRELGKGLREACIEGVREIGLAVTLATLTTVVVIVPMIFIGDGQARISLAAVGMPLSIALLGSLLVALLLLPSGLRHFGGQAMRKVDALGSRSRIGSWLDRLSIVRWLLWLNQAMLRGALRHRFAAGLLSLLCLSTCVLPFQWMEFSAGSGSMFRRGDVQIHMDLPKGLSLADAEREVIAYEQFVLDHKAEWQVDTLSSRFSRRSASVDITLAKHVPKKHLPELRATIEKAWPQRPGIRVKLIERDQGRGGGNSGTEKQERNFVVRLYGRDSRWLMQVADRVRTRLAALPEVDRVEIPQANDSEEVWVELDRDRMQELAIDPDVLFGTMVSGFQGQALTEFEEHGRETRLIAEFDYGDRNPSLVDLKDTKVYSGKGAFQQLSEVSGIQLAPSMGSIERIDGRTHVTILGQRALDVGPAAFGRLLQQVMREFPMPRGCSWSEDSQFLDNREQMFELFDAMMLGIVLIFLLMGVLFESLMLPLAIIALVPFAILGAAWSLWLFHGELDPMAVIGMILLAGTIVNNGIVLLDCIVRQRTLHDRNTAVLEGTRQRLRPILMTASTTIVGLLPMALSGESNQGLSYVSLSIVVAGGLAFSTMFTAFIVPLVYTLLDDLKQWLSAHWHRQISRFRSVVA